MHDRLGDECAHAEVIRRRIDFTLIAVATDMTHRRGAPPHKGAERGAHTGGKLSLGVSHRGIAGRDGGGGKKRGADKGRRRK